MTNLPENANERRMFNSECKTLYEGSALRHVAGSLTIYYQMAPEGGSYRECLAIYANECAKADAELRTAHERIAQLERQLEDALSLAYRYEGASSKRTAWKEIAEKADAALAEADTWIAAARGTIGEGYTRKSWRVGDEAVERYRARLASAPGGKLTQEKERT